MANKYRVYAKMTTRLYVDIIAEDKDDAYQMAREMDGGEFTDCGIEDSDWSIDNVEERE